MALKSENSTHPNSRLDKHKHLQFISTFSLLATSSSEHGRTLGAAFERLVFIMRNAANPECAQISRDCCPKPSVSIRRLWASGKPSPDLSFAREIWRARIEFHLRSLELSFPLGKERETIA